MNNGAKLILDYDYPYVYCVDENLRLKEIPILMKVTPEIIETNKNYIPIIGLLEVTRHVLVSWNYFLFKKFYLDISIVDSLCYLGFYLYGLYGDKKEILNKKYSYKELVELFDTIYKMIIKNIQFFNYSLYNRVNRKIEVHRTIETFLDIGFLRYDSKTRKYMFNKLILDGLVQVFKDKHNNRLEKLIFLKNLVHPKDHTIITEGFDKKSTKDYIRFFDIATYLIFNGYMETLGHPIFKARFKTRCTLSKLYRLLEKYFEVYGANTMFLQKNFIKLTCMLKDQNNVKIRLLIPVQIRLDIYGIKENDNNVYFDTIYFSIVNYDKQQNIDLTKIKEKLIDILREIDVTEIKEVDMVELPNNLPYAYVLTHPNSIIYAFHKASEYISYLSDNIEDMLKDEYTRRIVEFVIKTFDDRFFKEEYRKKVAKYIEKIKRKLEENKNPVAIEL